MEDKISNVSIQRPWEEKFSQLDWKLTQTFLRLPLAVKPKEFYLINYCFSVSTVRKTLLPSIPVDAILYCNTFIIV